MTERGERRLRGKEETVRIKTWRTVGGWKKEVLCRGSGIKERRKGMECDGYNGTREEREGGEREGK